MYKQVADQIRDAIASGSLASGEKLPSIRRLAETLGISPITIKRAYGDLEREGYLLTRAGLGSFVARIDRGRLRAEKAMEVRAEIERIAKAAAAFGIPLADVKSMVGELKEEIDG